MAQLDGTGMKRLHREWRRKLCRDRGPQTAQDIHDLGTGKAGKM